jgi:catechol 2,3-dioxygenase-like lactoylglutathione lyase family enzyme
MADKKYVDGSPLGGYKVMTAIAVNDLENAKDFYETVLGLHCLESNSAGLVFESGGGIIGIYESNSAGTSRSTAAWWKVDNVENVAKALKKRGVTFDKKYDMPRAKRKGDLYIEGRYISAWFRDPDGNILGIGNY